MPEEPTIESKVMRAIFQKKAKIGKQVLKKGKKGQNIWKFGTKCRKFENILQNYRWLSAIITHNKLLEKALTCYFQLFSFLPLFVNSLQKSKNCSKMFEGSSFHTHFHPFEDSLKRFCGD